MLHSGLDLSRKRLDVCLLSENGELVEEFSVPPDADGAASLEGGTVALVLRPT
jgi:transposase